MSSHRTQKQNAAMTVLGCSPKQLGIMAGLTVAYFLFICLNNLSTAKGIALFVTLCAVAALVIRYKQIRERLSIPFLALSAWVILNGISTLYAISGKFALKSFVVLLGSFCCVVLLLALAKGTGKELGRGFAAILEGAAAISGLVSIDLLSTHLISTPVLGILGLFTPDYSALTPVEVGVRINSIFTNPNVFAGCMGIGVFLSLGLALTSTHNAHRKFHLVCLYINALSFFLAFSMGGSATIAVGFLVYLLLERRETRGSLLVLMVETLILVCGAGFAVSATSLVEWTGFQPIPLLCIVVGAALLCVLDHFVNKGRGLHQSLFGLVDIEHTEQSGPVDFGLQDVDKVDDVGQQVDLIVGGGGSGALAPSGRKVGFVEHRKGAYLREFQHGSLHPCKHAGGPLSSRRRASLSLCAV